MQMWHTLLKLKKDHDIIGFKGWYYFITSFPQGLNGEFKYVITNPTFTGLGVGTGISHYVLSKEEIGELFYIDEKTFKELAKEMEEDYFKQDELDY